MTTSVNVSTVQTANTFDQWRIQTNLLKDDVNEIARGEFTKPTGNVTFTLGSLVLANSLGTTLSVAANAAIAGKLTIKDIDQTGSGARFDSESGIINFANAAGTIHANGNVRTRFLYNNTFFSAANINATGFIATTGDHANGNLIMNVANVLTVRSVANSSNVYITGNLMVSNIAALGNLVLSQANLTAANITTANVATLNVAAPGAIAYIANVSATNIAVANAIATQLHVLTQANVLAANITTLEVESLSVSTPISAPSESDSSEYRLRVSQTTRGDGTFGVFQGTSNGNASIKFVSSSNTWQATANDKQTFAPLLTTGNILSTYATDSSNVASLTLTKGANDNAIAALVAANSAANSVRVSANSGSTIAKASGINFVNTATILVEVGTGTSGNANISLSVDATNPALIGPQGVQGVQGVQGIGLQGVQGTSGIIGYNAGVVMSFNSGQTNDTDPGNGIFAFNSATISSVTYIYVDSLDYFGTDRSTHWTSFDDNNSTTNRGQLVLSSSGSSALGCTFVVRGSVLNGTGYYKIPVTYVSGTLPTNGAQMSFVFAPTGETGSQGFTGPQGQTGIQGFIGPQGVQGVQGLIGPQGVQGVQGRQGIIGLTGAPGAQGQTGLQGQTGQNGAQGQTGLQGVQGLIGPQGVQGVQGRQGVQGATGSGGLTGSGSASTLAYWSSTTNLAAGPTYSGGAIYASDFIISSDARLKDVRGKIEDPFIALDEIRGVRYTWNEVAKKYGKGSETELGVIAQEVLDYFPEAVVEDTTGYLSVKYDRLVPVLIEAVKNLNERVKQLEVGK